jgi:CheY-like chemotaxis protein
MKPYLVFIDDDPQELDDLGTIVSEAYDYSPVRWPAPEPLVLARMPDLVVLDLYYPRPDAPAAVSAIEMDAQRACAARIAGAFDTLYQGDLDGKALLRRTFGAIGQGYDLLWRQCAALGQAAEEGFTLLARLHADRRLADVPTVFYSRKVTVMETIRALQAGAFAVIPKAPSPPSRRDKEAVLAQFHRVREQYAQLTDLARKSGPSLSLLNLNVTLLRPEVSAEPLEVSFAAASA